MLTTNNNCLVRPHESYTENGYFSRHSSYLDENNNCLVRQHESYTENGYFSRHSSYLDEKIKTYVLLRAKA